MSKQSLAWVFFRRGVEVDENIDQASIKYEYFSLDDLDKSE